MRQLGKNVMNRIVRLLGLGALLLLIAISGLVFAHQWLGRHSEQIKDEAIAQKRAQLDALAALLPVRENLNPTDHLRALGIALGAQIEWTDASSADTATRAPASAKHSLSFEHTLPLPDQPDGKTVRVSFTRSSEANLRNIVQISYAVITSLILMLIAAIVFALLPSRSRGETALPPTQNELHSLAHLARLSEKQSETIESERTSRLRAEEDLSQKQLLLHHTLEEKIRLGRDLHDGVIQSLYATGLTLQAAQTQLPTAPAETARHLDSSLQLINQTIRDVRHYIEGLSPAKVRELPFHRAVEHELKNLCPTDSARFDLKIDPASAASLSETQFTELLQIIRESVSNSLRHGLATLITLRLEHNDDLLCLSLQDNGQGFDPEKLTSTGGHGLANLRARAATLSAKLKLHSQPGSGTRITLTFPQETTA